MLSLTYFSSQTKPFSEADLEMLHKKCVANNSRLGISGMLLHKSRNFIQVIEGDDQVVDELYARIAVDPRHRDLVVFGKRPIEQREFANWAMGFKNLDRVVASSIPGFVEENPNFSSQKFREDVGLAHRMLLFFAKR